MNAEAVLLDTNRVREFKANYKELKVGLIDYGAGNFDSVVRSLRALGVDPIRVHSGGSLESLSALTHLVFPGVGRASQAMKAIRSSGLDSVIQDHAAAKKPLLGICVGMQVLGRHSEEDDTACLGLLDFRLRHFETQSPVPHMGWNVCTFVQKQGAKSNEFLASLKNAQLLESPHFYFVHSYAALEEETNPDCQIGLSSYGGVSFVSVVGKENIVGTQFHVEKSGRAGLEFLRSFLNMGCNTPDTTAM